MEWLFWWRHPALYRTVIVNLATDDPPAIRGVLWQTRGAWLVLRQAALIKAHGDPLPVDGDVVVHRSVVTFIQAFPT